MGFTVKDLADSANISKSYLDYIESGNREPSPEKLKAIALTLNIDVEKLLEIQAEDSLNKAKNTQLSNRERMERVRNIENMLTLGMRNYLENDGWDVSDLPRSGFGDIKGEKDNTVWLVV